MQYLDSVELNNLTLLALFALPFAYFGYTAKYWYLPARIKALNSILVILSIAACGVVLFKLQAALRLGERAGIELAVLHLLPPLLAFLTVWRGSAKGSVAQELLGTRSSSSADTDFTPTKLNEKVQKLSWDQLVINPDLQRELMTVVNLLRDPKTAKQYGVVVPKGILLSGPPGTGKTTIAKVMANTAGLAFFALRANEIVSKWVGESEKNLSKLFDAAVSQAPSVLFIDEVEALGKKRSEKHASHEDNLLNHLLQLMDGVINIEGVYIIAATNRPDLVDEALKRAGRLNRVIQIPLPDREARRKLLELYLSKLSLAEDIEIEALIEVTEGNSPAEIREICNQAGLHAYRREAELPQKKRTFRIEREDLEAALSEFEVEEDDGSIFDESNEVQAWEPIGSKVEDLSWDDLIIDDELREELSSVIELLQNPAAAKKYGIDVPKGILLNGPPGTGKTTIAKVIANTSGLSFFVLKMNEVVSKWVGESEKNLTRLFKAAMKHAPSVIFIDEVDSIAKNRNQSNAQHADNLLNHLLQLVDGVIKTEGLYIVAATNRADLVDPALKRGGRLDRVIEIPLPDANGRRALFGLYLKRLNLSEQIDVERLVAATSGKSGADIRAICNQAGLNAFKRESKKGSRDFVVKPADIDAAVIEICGG